MSAEACSHSVECLSALAPTSPKSILSFLLCIPHPVCCLNPKALDLASRTTLKPTVVTDASNKRQAGARGVKTQWAKGSSEANRFQKHREDCVGLCRDFGVR